MSVVPESMVIAPYATSRDYEQLADLAKLHSIVCIVDYWRDEAIRDVARTTFFTKRGEEIWNISGRGTTYVSAFSRQEFLNLCRHSNVEFFVPPNTASS
jgi:hypothetical protein